MCHGSARPIAPQRGTRVSSVPEIAMPAASPKIALKKSSSKGKFLLEPNCRPLGTHLYSEKIVVYVKEGSAEQTACEKSKCQICLSKQSEISGPEYLPSFLDLPDLSSDT